VVFYNMQTYSFFSEEIINIIVMICFLLSVGMLVYGSWLVKFPDFNKKNIIQLEIK
jgi:hypothetical protein